MERKQAFLARIVDIGAELYAMSAACVKAHAERESRPEGVELADLFCRQAWGRAEQLFTDLWHNTDDVDVAAAARVTAGRYLHLEDGIIPAPGVGDWVSRWEHGASETTDVRRRITTPD
jgi:hypothetical protein